MSSVTIGNACRSGGYEICQKQKCKGRPPLPENKKLIEYLELESTETPVFVIFTRLKTGEILKSVLSLDDSSVENAYSRLSKIISDLTWAVQKIDSDNIEDYESVFNAVNMTAEGIQSWDTVRKIFGLYQWFKKLKP
jgi:hypothetical protein